MIADQIRLRPVVAVPVLLRPLPGQPPRSIDALCTPRTAVTRASCSRGRRSERARREQGGGDALVVPDGGAAAHLTHRYFAAGFAQHEVTVGRRRVGR